MQILSQKKNMLNQIQIFKRFLAHARLDTKQHQLEGVSWMLNQELNPEDANNIGGICADEMGLGKTIQMIGLIVSNLKANTLIVLPVSLLVQWENEIKRTLGFQPLVYYGKEKQDIDLDLLNLSPITLTTYGQLTSDLCILFKKKWDRVIYDEAHHMKNSNTRLWNIQSKLIRTYTWLVTGTPIHNSLRDVKNLFRLIGLREIHKRYEDYIKSYILKRTKAECNIVLPEVESTNIVVPFESDIESQEQHEKIISKELHSQLSFSQINIETDSRKLASYMSTIEKLPLILQCRQMCIMPRLLQGKMEVTSQFCSLDDDYHSFSEAVRGNSKLNKICQDLQNRKNGRSKLVFCSFRMEMDYLEQQTKAMGYKVGVIDGRTTHTERKQILSQTYDVLILQIYTCSEGINLQNYSEIYITSPNWNPAIEDQAVGRCHRIGQQSKVYVYRYVMDDFDLEGKEKSMDNYIENIQEKKREIYI